MRAITLHQPWASLVALGVKTIETRSWGTKYRGPLAIQAGRVTAAVGAPIWDELGRLVVEEGQRVYPLGFPTGAVIAVCTLIDMALISDRPNGGWRAEGRFWNLEPQRPYGDFTPGRWAWLLGDVELLEEPIPARGRQGLWEWTA